MQNYVTEIKRNNFKRVRIASRCRGSPLDGRWMVHNKIVIANGFHYWRRWLAQYVSLLSIQGHCAIAGHDWKRNERKKNSILNNNSIRTEHGTARFVFVHTFCSACNVSSVIQHHIRSHTVFIHFAAIRKVIKTTVSFRFVFFTCACVGDSIKKATTTSTETRTKTNDGNVRALNKGQWPIGTQIDFVRNRRRHGVALPSRNGASSLCANRGNRCSDQISWPFGAAPKRFRRWCHHHCVTLSWSTCHTFRLLPYPTWPAISSAFNMQPAYRAPVCVHSTQRGKHIKCPDAHHQIFRSRHTFLVWFFPHIIADGVAGRGRSLNESTHKINYIFDDVYATWQRIDGAPRRLRCLTQPHAIRDVQSLPILY